MSTELCSGAENGVTRECLSGRKHQKSLKNNELKRHNKSEMREGYDTGMEVADSQHKPN